MLLHPVDGFYEMKFEKRGRYSVAVLNFILMWISYAIYNQYGSVVVNQRNPISYNALVDFGTVSVMFILWCVANWSVTSLANGEGKLGEIAMATCYAMTPIILTFIPMTLLSHVMAEGETAFYFLAIGAAVVYFVVLMFTGMMTVHNYSPGKTIGVIALTFLAMLIIVFLIMLLSTLWSQLYVFVYSIYIELSYRG